MLWEADEARLIAECTDQGSKPTGRAASILQMNDKSRAGLPVAIKMSALVERYLDRLERNHAGPDRPSKKDRSCLPAPPKGSQTPRPCTAAAHPKRRSAPLLPRAPNKKQAGRRPKLARRRRQKFHLPRSGAARSQLAIARDLAGCGDPQPIAMAHDVANGIAESAQAKGLADDERMHRDREDQRVFA